MPSRYNTEQREQLLSIALQSIRHGLALGSQLATQYQDINEALLEHRCCFVTLRINSSLRGCMGSIQANEALIDNVISNAYNAAFNDPRFSPLQADELTELSIHISVLSPSQPLRFSSERELLPQLRPGIDGLVLRENNHCATFLPSVWDQLPEPDDFLGHLKKKAGLSEHYWSNTLSIERYTVESFEK